MKKTDAALAAAASEAWNAKAVSSAFAAAKTHRKAVTAKVSDRPLSPMVMDFVEDALMRNLAERTRAQQPQSFTRGIDRNQRRDRFAAKEPECCTTKRVPGAGAVAHRHMARTQGARGAWTAYQAPTIRSERQSLAAAASARTMSSRAMIPTKRLSPSVTGRLRMRCSTISCSTRVSFVSGLT